MRIFIDYKAEDDLIKKKISDYSRKKKENLG